MRAEGSSVSDPREWAPSPVWPEGRGIFLLRPLLSLTRTDIRDYLAREGETWLEDPANLDLRYARARARASASGAPSASPGGISEALPPPTFEVDAAGVIRLSRDVAPAHLAAALLCASGTERPPRGERLARLVERVRTGDAFTATLAGARLEATSEILVCRDAGEVARGGLARLDLPPREAGVWDGRWEIVAGALPVTVGPLKGQGARLAPRQRARLVTIPAAARPSLPLMMGAAGDGPVELMLDGPELAAEGEARARSLVLDRFKAAVGLFDQESVT